ncbi:sensor histidine kinase [Streptomyces sp. NPDC050564]|uniref:sensor histidine kinase n=1 Tax=Streptomyces sp. NPDC050564 TaxID=3365631 RepID=UPI0037B07EC7
MEQDVAGVEQRWAAIDHRGPYLLLMVGGLLAVPTGGLFDMGPGDWYTVGGLVAAGLVLQVWWGTVADSRRGPSAMSISYYAVRWLIAFVLTWINPFFCFYAFTGYFGARRLLPRRLLRKAGLFATAVTMAGAQSGGLPPREGTQWLLFGAILAITLVLVGVSDRLFATEDERARVQAETIAELERTNTALQQALDENAALHAQLLVQAREAGVADERRRLAAEIHDTIAQGLTGIIAQLQVVANTPDPAAAREHLGRAADLARHSLGEARRSVQNLAPVALADDGLPEALKKTVAEWGERAGVRAGFTLTGTAEQLHDEVSATLLRIAQEALSNAARHAAASRVGVTLSFMDEEVTLDIRDDGRGFDPVAVPERTGTGGFGLDGMRARAERIAGALTVESEPGQGTAVSARVPLVRHDR